MRITAYMMVLLSFLSLLIGCHPSNPVSESGDEGQLNATQNPTVHQETQPNVTLPPMPSLGVSNSADSQLDTAILKSFCDLTGGNFLKEGGGMQVRHFGKFGDIYAVYIDGPWIYTQAIRNVTVFGFNFIFPDGQRMYLYRDGQICAVDDAEKENFATKDEIQSLWAYYKEKAGRLYGDAVTE